MSAVGFEAISGKYLSSVEVNHFQSNQHELNGIIAFKILLGEQRRSLSPKLYYIDQDLNIIKSTCDMTWYDAREAHPSRSEHRLYYSNNVVFSTAQVDDLMLLGETDNGNYIIIVINNNSSIYKSIPHKLNFNYIGENFTINLLQDRDFLYTLWNLCNQNSNISRFESFLNDITLKL